MICLVMRSLCCFFLQIMQVILFSISLIPSPTPNPLCFSFPCLLSALRDSYLLSQIEQSSFSIIFDFGVVFLKKIFLFLDCFGVSVPILGFFREDSPSITVFDVEAEPCLPPFFTKSLVVFHNFPSSDLISFR